MKLEINAWFRQSSAILIISLIAVSESAESNGLGDDIDWQTWSEGLLMAKDTGKPIMLILHKSWCPACKALKPKFEASKDIGQLSSHFVMINAKEGEEPMDEPKLNIDGAYIPRVIFLDSEANVLTEVSNEKGNPKYMYYHMDATSIVESMKKVLNVFKNTDTTEPIPSDEL